MLEEILNLCPRESFGEHDGCPETFEETSSRRGNGLVLFCFVPKRTINRTGRWMLSLCNYKPWAKWRDLKWRDVTMSFLSLKLK